MTPEELQALKNQVQLLQARLDKFEKGDRFLITRDIELPTEIGIKIGTTVNQKLGFYNTKPIVQRSGSAQVAVSATSSTNVTPYGYSSAVQADAIVTLVNELRAWAVAQGFIKGSA